MREIDNDVIREHADIRFRSSYHYALFEYYRSAKILRRLEWDGIAVKGRVLDAGCGSGGIAVSFAEECDQAIGLDIKNKFSDSGVRFARERKIDNAHFVQGDGAALPFTSESFDIVLSHSVIEHVRLPNPISRNAIACCGPAAFCFFRLRLISVLPARTSRGCASRSRSIFCCHEAGPSG